MFSFETELRVVTYKLFKMQAEEVINLKAGMINRKNKGNK